MYFIGWLIVWFGLYLGVNNWFFDIVGLSAIIVGVISTLIKSTLSVMTAYDLMMLILYRLGFNIDSAHLFFRRTCLSRSCSILYSSYRICFLANWIFFRNMTWVLWRHLRIGHSPLTPNSITRRFVCDWLLVVVIDLIHYVNWPPIFSILLPLVLVASANDPCVISESKPRHVCILVLLVILVLLGIWFQVRWITWVGRWLASLALIFLLLIVVLILLFDDLLLFAHEAVVCHNSFASASTHLESLAYRLLLSHAHAPKLNGGVSRFVLLVLRLYYLALNHFLITPIWPSSAAVLIELLLCFWLLVMLFNLVYLSLHLIVGGSWILILAIKMRLCHPGTLLALDFLLVRIC